jgi:predicted chitinase
MPASNSLTTLMTEAQFNTMFPQRIPFYSYAGLVAAADATEGFAKEGSIETRKRELAALLANGEHESDHYKATREYNTANYDKYCDRNNTTYPCSGNQQYYGRGPIQLSWNYNYGEAGKFIGADLLHNPDLVATDSKIAWQTMMWFWMKSEKEGFTPHTAMTKEAAGVGGFGTTINVINGGLECGKGGNSLQVQSRINNFNSVLKALGVSAGPGRIDC